MTTRVLSRSAAVAFLVISFWLNLPSFGASNQQNPSSIIKPLPHRQLTQAEIKDNLSKLLEWRDSSPYFYYFFDLAGPLQLKERYAARYNDMIGKNFGVRPYAIGNLDAQITLIVPPELQVLPNSDGMCVALDGFGGPPVPIPAAEMFSASFANGFVTRLVLGEYIRAWDAHGSKFSQDDLNFPIGMGSLPIPTAFSQIASYQVIHVIFGQAAGPPEYNLRTGLSRLLQDNSLQAAGLLWGWKAASELDQFRNNGDPQYYNAAFKLVRSRFSTEQIGEMTAYSLSYLIGYSKMAVIRQVELATGGRRGARGGQISAVQGFARGARGGPISAVQGAADQNAISAQNNAILNRITQDRNADEAKQLLSSFYIAFLSEFSALAENSRLDPTDKQALLAASFAFLRGFQKGETDAADRVFQDVFTLAYGIGYKDGFQDGFTQGYASGYRDGYASGYSEAWSKASEEISNLQRQLAQEEQQLAQGISPDNSNAGGIGKWIDEVGNIAEKAGPVIATIAALF
jgi:hypothetical protein